MLGGLSAVQALKGEVSQGKIAIQIYSDYFGKLPYDHVALTEQTACNYGQSWPMLVYLPICGLWDKTVQQQLGLLNYDASYWREVTPHEVSHQWWGQLVGFNSYRDQWMSEGFANFSVGVFLRHTSPKMDDYRAFWKEQQKNLLQKNKEGVRPIDAGALTMGTRVSNEKNGNVYQLLIYSKGAYVLHMLEMAVLDDPGPGDDVQERDAAVCDGVLRQGGDDRGLEGVDGEDDAEVDGPARRRQAGLVLRRVCLRDRAATLYDRLGFHDRCRWRHLRPSEVVAEQRVEELRDADAAVSPVEEWTDAAVLNVVIHGSETIDQIIKLGKLPSPAKTMLLNYNADVLSDN